MSWTTGTGILERAGAVCVAAAVVLGVVTPVGAVAREDVPLPALLDEPGVAQVAPEAMMDRILTALMFDPDGRLAGALFAAFRRAMTATGDEGAATTHSHELAQALLRFLPMDQARRAAPDLLLSLAPEPGGQRLNAAVELAALTGQDAEDLMLEAQRLAAERDALLPLSIGGRVKLPALGTVDPPPSLSVDVVRLPGTIREDDVLALISGDRQRALILYRLLAIMPDITDTAAYARWYRQWELLTAMDPGATPSPPPLHGGPTASPH